MTAKEAKEIIVGMEVSADTMLKADELLSKYQENDEVPDEVIDEILRIVDVDFDPANLVEEEIVN